MDVVLSEGWGGRRASEAVVETLAQAQALAACQHRTAVGADDVLGALLSTAEDPVTHVGVVLRAHGLVPAELSRGRPRPDGTEPSFEAGDRPSTPAPVGTAVAALLQDLDAWMSVTGDERITTLHLLAALSRSATPEGAFLRRARLTPDAVLTIGARCRADVHDEDAAFARDDAKDADSHLLSVPDIPGPADLKTRTGGRRSPTVARLMSTQLPRGARVNTRLGVVTVRRWALSMSFCYLVTLGTGLFLLDQAMEEGAWTLVVCAFFVWTQLSFAPWGVWLSTKAVALWLAPSPLRWFVLASALLELACTRYELWMKRVDLATPDLSLSRFSRAYRREAFEAALNRMRTRYEN